MTTEQINRYNLLSALPVLSSRRSISSKLLTRNSYSCCCMTL